MIHSNVKISSREVARHYDELDVLYRKVWGEHVHHGLFLSSSDPKETATERLSHEVARLAGITSGDSVCDIGCGYGATAEILANHYHANVLGLTISPLQFSKAASRKAENLQFRLLNWLENDLPSDSFDHLISIESSEHMPDKQKFFSESSRVLKNQGSFVICAWLSGESPNPWEKKHLLEPICREGRLPSMGTESEYRGLFKSNGFRVEAFQDMTRFVKRTWTVSIQNLLCHFAHQPKDLQYLLPNWNSNAEFAKTLLRIRLAYETGAMRYGIFKAVKILGPNSH